MTGVEEDNLLKLKGGIPFLGKCLEVPKSVTENGDVLNDNSEPMEGPENGDSLKSNSNSEKSESPCAAPDPKSLETEQPMEQPIHRS
ncbi:hypothetical protein SUGI_0052480 [Cryptomeria japonica]|nr:hypothetical protein SUGI_0052480 [Cryptomeria japonica]